MCGPIAAAVISGAGSIFGAMQQASVANANAKIAENQAQATRDKAKFDARREQDARKSLISSNRVAGLSSGVDINQGAGLDVILDNFTNSVIDEEAIRFSGEANARNLEGRASVFRSQGRNAITAGAIGALAPIVRTPSSAFNINSRFSTPVPVGGR